MKNIFKILVPLFLMLVLISGCEDFLQKDPQGDLTQAQFPVNAEDALLATNAIYSSLRSWHYNSGGFPILDIMSDDALKGSSPNDGLPTVGPYDNFTITATQDGLDRWWNSLYEGVKRANVVIEKVPGINMNEDLKARYIGEAYFLRALFYFDLVRAWGGVPKITSLTPSPRVPRSSREEIYQLIEEDLLSAIDRLEEKSQLFGPDIGRATVGAARSLLSKVHLFQNEFLEAKNYALQVIRSEEYSLEPDFADANSEAGENGVESIFEIGALRTETGGGGNQYANTQGVRGTPNRGWGFNRPSLDLRASFEPGDPRKEATIIELGETLDGILIKGDGTTPDEVKDNQGNVIEIESYNQKVWTAGDNTTTQFGYNRRILRYADILLIAAEAYNELGQPDSALFYLNKVRERARGGNLEILPDIMETSKDPLRSLILKERRNELALEGHRFWDLVRTGMAPAVLGPLGFTPGKDELLPIPQNQIDLTQGVITQNPNWS